MDAKTFLGYTTGSSAYDGRRHVNYFLVHFVSYNTAIDSSLIPYGRTLLDALRSQNFNKAYDICVNHLLTPIQKRFLECLKRKKGLTQDEYTTILSGISLTESIMRTPAGYSKVENKRMFIHNVVATMFMQPQVQYATNEFYNGCFKTFSVFLSTNEMMNILRTTQSVCENYSTVDSVLNNLSSIESQVLSRV